MARDAGGPAELQSVQQRIREQEEGRAAEATKQAERERRKGAGPAPTRRRTPPVGPAYAKSAFSSLKIGTLRKIKGDEV